MSVIRKEVKEAVLLLRNVPSTIVSLVVLCTILMNLLANREFIKVSWFACDCGALISWIPFAFALDLICKRFGGKAATTVSVFAVLLNLITCGILKLLMLSPGHWGEFYSSNLTAVDDALNATFAGGWYIVIMSGIAALVGAIVNSAINQFIGKRFDKGDFKGFALRSYISTFISLVVNVLVFSIFVSHILFGWSWGTVWVCAISNSVMQLAFEIIISPLGFKICKAWERDNVGAEWLERMS